MNIYLLAKLSEFVEGKTQNQKKYLFKSIHAFLERQADRYFSLWSTWQSFRRAPRGIRPLCDYIEPSSASSRSSWAAISLLYCHGVYLVSISRFNIYPKYVLRHIHRVVLVLRTLSTVFALGQSDLIDLHMIYMSAPNLETDDHALIFSLQQGICDGNNLLAESITYIQSESVALEYIGSLFSCTIWI